MRVGAAGPGLFESPGVVHADFQQNPRLTVGLRRGKKVCQPRSPAPTKPGGWAEPAGTTKGVVSFRRIRDRTAWSSLAISAGTLDRPPPTGTIDGPTTFTTSARGPLIKSTRCSIVSEA